MKKVLLLICLTCIQENNATFVRYKDTTRENMTAETSVGPPLTVESKIHCIHICGTNSNAVAVFYTKNNYIRTCKCSITQTRPLNRLTQELGTVHLVKKICEVDGYNKMMENFCVKAFDTALTYDKAGVHCVSDNGRLVRLDTQQKIAKLRTYLVTVTVSNNMVYYIDGTRSDAWRFSDGSEINTFQWAINEPHGWPEHYWLSLYINYFLLANTTCVGNVVGYTFGFICER